jgi:hypothetical protein
MLRVRPIHFTSRVGEWEGLLTALGLVKSVDEGSWQVFDAGSGRLALHATESGSEPGGRDGFTAFGVEVGDLEEFARRTNEYAAESGKSPAELVRAEHGDSCRITGEDGFSFFADPAADGAASSDADAGLAVVEVWYTEDPAAAAETLRSIGARSRPVPDNDETADFTAKNGGVLMVRPGSGAARAGFGFEYDGDLDALAGRLRAAGHDVRATEEAFARSLHVSSPDPGAPALWISGRTGYPG